MVSPSFDAFVLKGGGYDDLVLGLSRYTVVRGGALIRQALRCDEGAGLYAEESEVDGLAVLVVRVGDGEPQRSGIFHTVDVGELVGLCNVDDGAREGGIGLCAVGESDDVTIHCLQAGNTVVNQSGCEAGDDDDQQGHERQHDAHEKESGARKKHFAQG